MNIMNSLYKSEDNEKKKFKVTRGMLILIGMVLIFIIIVIIILSSMFSKKGEKYTTDDFSRLEERMKQEAPIYVSQKNIELTSKEYRIELSDMLTTNGGAINPDRVKAANIFTGYVIAKKTDTESYNAYIKCKNLYTTTGYVSNDEKTTAKITKTNKDKTKPDITLVGEKEIIINKGEEFKDPGAKATDNIDGDITSMIKITGKVDTSKTGTYVLTYSVSDKAGNKNSKTRKVIVTESKKTTTTTTTTKRPDTTTNKPVTTKTTRRPNRTNTTRRITTTIRRVPANPPVITLKGQRSITLKVGTNYKEPGYSANDGFGNDITSMVKVTTNVNTNSAGTYYVNYAVTDSYGLSTAVKRIVTVKSTYVKVTGIRLVPNATTIKKGSQKSLSVSYTPSNATNKSVSWSSSNSSVAIVSGGVVTAKNKGITIITAKSPDGATASTRVTVE